MTLLQQPFTQVGTDEPGPTCDQDTAWRVGVSHAVSVHRRAARTSVIARGRSPTPPPSVPELTTVGRPVALLVEDTREYVLIGSTLLESEGFEVVAAGDGETGLGLARSFRPEVVLLDVSLPGIDGFEVCRRLREFSDAYVIMVTGRTDEVDRIVGLTVGADDYVTKPFSARELAARIAAMRRRPRAAVTTTRLEFDGLTIDVAAREVTLDGNRLELTKIEFDLLAKLASEPRRVFARQQLLDAVWGGDWYGDDHVVDVHMGNLRKKLGESGSNPRFIHTVRGVGFRFEIKS